MTESSVIQTILELGYFLVIDGLSGNILLRKGKDSNVEEEEEEVEEDGDRKTNVGKTFGEMMVEME